MVENRLVIMKAENKPMNSHNKTEWDLVEILFGRVEPNYDMEVCEANGVEMFMEIYDDSPKEKRF